MILLEGLSNGLEIELMTKLVPVFEPGILLPPGLRSDRAQVRGTAPCMPATVIQFFEMSEEQS